MKFWAAVAMLTVLLSSCLEDYPTAPVSPYEQPAMRFVESLVVPATGLVASRPNECFTTVYKNSLAAMAFLHQGNHAAAIRIFDYFSTFLSNQPGPFRGFPQSWDPCTGQPLDDNYWEGDNAFLLLALNYFRITSSSPERYMNLTMELVAWLSLRGNNCSSIVAEGTANMYAALKPFEANPSVASALVNLKQCFQADVAYDLVLDHTVRGFLVFGKSDGFEQLSQFALTESWIVTGEPIDAYKAFASDTFANVEISAQLLLAARLSGHEYQAAGLRVELEKLWIYTASGKEAGLPYFLRQVGFPQSAELGIVDPTIYLLFVYWQFNPFMPTKNQTM